MSHSSAATLISPSTSTGLERVSSRKSTAHSHSAHPAHPARHTTRRSSHHASHGPSSTGGPSRKSSDGEGGRRGMTAGLTMKPLQGDKPKRKGSGDHPLPKSSRSDTHLPRLSRTASRTSTTSHTSSNPQNQARPKGKGRKRSGDSVQILSEDGQHTLDSSEEGWESGEEDKQKDTARDIRRTVSETQAETAKPSASATPKGVIVESPLGIPEPEAPSLHRKRTTGFAGSTHETTHSQQAHQYNDSNHVMPLHQVRHQSARDLAAMAMTDGERGRDTPVEEKEGHVPFLPQRMRSTDGSGLVGAAGPADGSPSFPFPALPQVQQPSTLRHEQGRSYQQEQSSSVSPTDTVQPRMVSNGSAARQRNISGPDGPRLRHRQSNSSLRSIQSLRAPPHPLNSPTGYRSGMLPTSAVSRGGSAVNSPSRPDRRGPSMHHPPIAPPVVYREIATGQGWDIPEDDVSTHTSTTLRNPPTPQTNGSKHNPRASFSSTRSLQSLLGAQPSSNRRLDPPQSTTTSSHPPAPTRRRTALEVASAASRLSTTTDPVIYHHSLGYPSTTAETSHLISRFLPPKRETRPEWEISPESARNRSGDGGEIVGLALGDYREAHESLIRMMRELGGGERGMGTRRSGSRAASYNYSYGSLLGAGGSSAGVGPIAGGGVQGVNGSGEEGVGPGVGVVKGRNGNMLVARGGWRGKTPFELSVERCLAQRPQRAMTGM